MQYLSLIFDPFTEAAVGSSGRYLDENIYLSLSHILAAFVNLTDRKHLHEEVMAI